MNQGLQRLLTEKRTFYALLVMVVASALVLLTADIFTQSRDGRHQIIDEDGGQEWPVWSDSGSAVGGQSGAEFGAYGGDGLKSAEELRLQAMLADIAGVGENQVMITRKVSRAVSVFAGEDGGPEGEIRGVIVAAEGAGNPAVKLSIAEAVSAVYGIDRTCVKVFQLEK